MAQTVIETTCNQLFRIRETGRPELAHVWHGVPVKRARGGFADKVNAREILVRKAGARFVGEVAC